MPDALSMEALSALETALTTLLPAAVPAGLARQVLVHPQRVRSLGLGGYVGRHVEPAASLHGRHLEARLEISLDGDEGAARTYGAALAAALLTHSRGELARHGVRRIERVSSEKADTVLFDVDFEFVHLPTAGEGIIEEILLQALPEG